MTDDMPELLSELKQRQARIRYLEIEIATARRAPDMVAEVMATVEATARDKLTRLRETMLDDQEGLRALFLSLFPDGLVFKPAKIRNRRVWSISGDANLGGTKSHGDPTGIRGDLGLRIFFNFKALDSTKSAP